MYFTMRRWFGAVLGALGFLGAISPQSHAQFHPILNPYVNPYVAQQTYQAAVMGQMLRNEMMAAAIRNQVAAAAMRNQLVANVVQNEIVGAAVRNQAALNTAAILRTRAAAAYGIAGAPWNYGMGYGVPYGGGAYAPVNALGYASLVSTAGGGYGLAGGYGLGGYGLGGYGLYGGGFGGALGAGTQWMMNPYSGYMEGAASITKANAQYYSTIQQAKLERQDAIRSSLQTRRAFLEEAEYERAHAPDPEKLRQLAIAREINRARVDPPLTDIWTGRSLNALYDHLAAQQGEGVKGPAVPLSEDTLNHLNLTSGESRGNVGLLKDNGNLKWPLALQKDMFQEPREKINALMKRVYRTVQTDKPDDATLHDLQANYRLMQDILVANGDRLTTDQYIEARRYLGTVGHTITALKDRNVSNFFNGNWTPKVKSVAELIQFMREKGLLFAPATQRDEAAYVSLYHALAAFDAGMPRVASNSGSALSNIDNK